MSTNQESISKHLRPLPVQFRHLEPAAGYTPTDFHGSVNLAPFREARTQDSLDSATGSVERAWKAVGYSADDETAVRSGYSSNLMEFGVVLAESEAASLRAIGEAISDSDAIFLLERLADEDDLPLDQLRESFPSVLALAAAGLVFTADQRLFPSTTGLAILSRLKDRFDDGAE